MNRNINHGIGYVNVAAKDTWKMSVPYVQFHYEIKTALKKCACPCTSLA